jgi:hypothetical protein
MAEEAPLGPRQLDIGKLTDEQFQEMCSLLVRLEFPDARSTDNPDGGADTLLARPEGGWERAWQAKRYTGTVYWGKCRDSLDRAVKNYGVERMTFCFARNLTVGQEKNFQKKLVGKHKGVIVDYWNKDEIVARLNGSEEGQRIARHYFGDPLGDKQQMLRAIRAGGELETLSDVIERKRPSGEFLKEHDPFYSYSVIEYEQGYDAPGHPDAAVSFLSTQDGVTERIDAVPRDDDALERFTPTVRLRFPNDKAGKRLAEELERALRQHRDFSAEGIEFEFEQLPPLFEKDVGKVGKGTVTLTAIKPVPAPWVAEMTARSERWTDTVTMNMEMLDPPPKGWDVGFAGHFAGMTLTILLAWRGAHGEVSFNWRHEIVDAPARDQLRALRFLAAMHGPGELVMRDLVGGRQELRQDLAESDLDETTLLLIDLMENIVTIEDWTGETIDIPEQFTGQDANEIAFAAAKIRKRELPVTFTDAKLDVLPEAIDKLREGGEIVIEEDMGLRVFGREIRFARTRFVMPEYEVEDLGPIGNDGAHKVVLRPVGGPVSTAYMLGPPRKAEPAA